MDKSKNYLNLKRFCYGLGLDLFGVADIAEIKQEFLFSQELLKQFDKAVCLGARLSHGVLSDITTAPTKLYFHHYRTVNAFLDQCALRTSRYLESKGHVSLPVAASQIVDWEKQNAHLSHKKIGYLAGLGWIGRNNLLVNKKLGSRFRLVTVLTDMPLAVDTPLKDGCGTCRRCIEICPCKAIKETPSDFDHVGCYEQLRGYQKQRIVDQFICGVCVNVCKGK